MTLSGLWIFLDISDTCWYSYKKKEDFAGVIKQIEHIIRTQKFEGAAAGFLNPNIIARDLGLVEKSEQKVDLEMSLSEKTDEQLDEELNELLGGDDK